MPTTATRGCKRPRADDASTNENDYAGWICPICTLQNAAHRRRCGACESRRPVAEPDTDNATTTTRSTPPSNTSDASVNAAATDNNNDDVCHTTRGEKTARVRRPSKRARRKAPVAAWLVNRRRRRRGSSSVDTSTMSSPDDCVQEEDNASASLQIVKLRLRQGNFEYEAGDEHGTTWSLPQDDRLTLEALVPLRFVQRSTSLTKMNTVKSDDKTSESSSSDVQQSKHNQTEDICYSFEPNKTTITQLTGNAAVESSANPASSDDSTFEQVNKGCETRVTSERKCKEHSYVASTTNQAPVLTNYGESDRVPNVDGAVAKSPSALSPLLSTDGQKELSTSDASPRQLQNEGTPDKQPTGLGYIDNSNEGELLVNKEKNQTARIVVGFPPSSDRCGGEDNLSDSSSTSSQDGAAPPQTERSEKGVKNNTDVVARATLLESPFDTLPTKPSGHDTINDPLPDETLDSVEQEKIPLDHGQSETPTVVLDAGVGESVTDGSPQNHKRLEGKCGVSLGSHCQKMQFEPNFTVSGAEQSQGSGRYGFSRRAEQNEAIQMENNSSPPGWQSDRVDRDPRGGPHGNFAESKPFFELPEIDVLHQTSSAMTGCEVREKNLIQTEKSCSNKRIERGIYRQRLDGDCPPTGVSDSHMSETPDNAVMSSADRLNLRLSDVKLNETSPQIHRNVEKDRFSLQEYHGAFRAFEPRSISSEYMPNQSDAGVVGEAGTKETKTWPDAQERSTTGSMSERSPSRAPPGEHAALDTPSARPWQPITQNDGTLAFAGQFEYTPASQSQEYSCSQESLSQECSWAGQSPSQLQSFQSSHSSPDACADVKHRAGLCASSKIAVLEKPDKKSIEEIVDVSLVGVTKMNNKTHCSCENPSSCNGLDEPDSSMVFTSRLDNEGVRSGQADREQTGESGVSFGIEKQIELKRRPPRVSFRTAGKEKEIVIDEMALSRAHSILSKSPSQPTFNADTLQGRAPIEGGKSPFEGATVAADKQNQFTKKVQGAVDVLFKTAGEEKTIEIDNMALSRARKMIASIPYDGGGPVHNDNKMEKPGMDRRTARPTRVSFQTAGTGQIVQAAEEDLQRARDLLSVPASCTFETALQGQGPFPGKTTSSVRSSGLAAPRLSFQTAGRNKRIEISDKDLGRARRLLSSPLSRPSSSVNGPNPVYSDRETRVTETMSLKRPCVSFQTAGKGETVKAREEDLKRARNLLSASPRAQKENIGKLPFVSSKLATPAAEDRVSRPALISFQTAGKGTAIVAPNDAMERAKRLFSEPSPCPSGSRNSGPTPGPRRVSFHTARHRHTTETLEGDLEGVRHFYSSTSIVAQPNDAEPVTTSREFKTPGAAARNPYAAVVTFPSERRQDLTRLAEADTGAISLASNLRTPVSESMDPRPARLSFNSASGTETVNEPDSNPNFDGTPLGRDLSSTINSTLRAASRLQEQQLDDDCIHCRTDKGSQKLNVPICQAEELPPPRENKPSVPLLDGSDTPYFNSARRKENFSPHGLHGTGHAIVSEGSATFQMMTSQEESAEYGVTEVLFSINGENGADVSFDDAGRPVNLSGTKDETEKKVRKGMVSRGCDCSKISSKWIQNHCRWISWKLASIERRFPYLLARPYFTMQRLLDELHRRFEREVVDGLRTPLRKVLNRDVAACSMMILCVAKVNLYHGNSVDGGTGDVDSSHTVELTDGWYSVLAKPDRYLCEMMDRSRIRVGTKLLISNSSLHGSEDGVDPLDEEYQCSSETYLRIFSNSTRLARWDAKLGFIRMTHALKETDGLLHVQSLRDVFEGGGRVPSIDFTVVKRFPRLFLHHEDNGRSSVLSEFEEEKRLQEIEDAKAKVADEVSGQLEEECSKDVDEMAPSEWKDMLRQPCPDDFLRDASDSTKSVIRTWQDKRKHLITERIRQELEARFEEHGLDKAPSKPFVRFLVQDSRNALNGASSTNNQCQALLTVWGPSTGQLELLKEQSTLRARQIAVKNDKFDGLLQISASNRTIFFELPMKPVESGKGVNVIPGERSMVRGVFQTCLLSARLDPSEKHGRQIDLAGTPLRVDNSNGRCYTYLTDRSGMILRVESDAALCEHTEPTFTPLLLRSIEIRPFDAIEDVAVAAYSPLSSLSDDWMSPTVHRLSRWLRTEEGRRQVELTLAILTAKVPTKFRLRTSGLVLLAYLVEFTVLENKHLIVKVDTGGEGLLNLDLPFSLLLKIQTDATGVVFGPKAERKVSGDLFRARSLHRIVADKMDRSIPGHEEVTHQIVDMSKVNLNDMMDWYAKIGMK